MTVEESTASSSSYSTGSASLSWCKNCPEERKKKGKLQHNSISTAKGKLDSGALSFVPKIWHNSFEKKKKKIHIIYQKWSVVIIVIHATTCSFHCAGKQDWTVSVKGLNTSSTDKKSLSTSTAVLTKNRAFVPSCLAYKTSWNFFTGKRGLLNKTTSCVKGDIW